MGAVMIQSWYSGGLPQLSFPFSMLLLFIKDSFENASFFAVLRDFLVLFYLLLIFFCPTLDQKYKGAKAFHNENKVSGGNRRIHIVTNSDKE